MLIMKSGTNIAKCDIFLYGNYQHLKEINILYFDNETTTTTQGTASQNSRYLQGTGPQHSGPLIFSHVRSRDPLLVRLLPFTRWQDLYVLLVFLLNKLNFETMRHQLVFIL